MARAPPWQREPPKAMAALGCFSLVHSSSASKTQCSKPRLSKRVLAPTREKFHPVHPPPPLRSQKPLTFVYPQHVPWKCAGLRASLHQKNMWHRRWNQIYPYGVCPTPSAPAIFPSAATHTEIPSPARVSHHPELVLPSPGEDHLTISHRVSYVALGVSAYGPARVLIRFKVRER